MKSENKLKKTRKPREKKPPEEPTLEIQLFDGLSAEDGLRTFIAHYYLCLEVLPDVRNVELFNLDLIERIDKQYRIWLLRQRHDTDLWEEQFLNQIDFLTGAVTKQEKARAAYEEKQAVIEKIRRY